MEQLCTTKNSIDHQNITFSHLFAASCKKLTWFLLPAKTDALFSLVHVWKGRTQGSCETDLEGGTTPGWRCHKGRRHLADSQRDDFQNCVCTLPEKQASNKEKDGLISFRWSCSTDKRHILMVNTGKVNFALNVLPYRYFKE